MSPQHDQPELPLFQPVVTFHPIVLDLGNGRFEVRAGKPMIEQAEHRISTRRASELLGLSVSRIECMCAEGLLEAEQPGGKKGHWKIKLSSVLARKGPPGE